VRASPENRNEFAKSLPQEILSELVIVMSDMPVAGAPIAQKHHIYPGPVEPEAETRPAAKRPRKSAPELVLDEGYEPKLAVKKLVRKSEPARRRTAANAPVDGWGSLNTPEKEIEYCKDLIDRMIRGPGYWTRLVGPFRHPVDPVTENIPNYFDVVKKPVSLTSQCASSPELSHRSVLTRYEQMDLSTIKIKIHNGEYANGAGFEADVRLIHQNCYEYWTQEDPMWKACEDFEKYFNTQWGERWKWTPGSKYHRSVKAEILD